jgi:flagellar hook-associated protein FlgK
VCSTPEAALQDLVRAIDELAADSGSSAAHSQLAERIARLWGMITDLDPELARRRSAYEGTPDD